MLLRRRLEATATPRKRSQHSCLQGKKATRHGARWVQQANGRAAGTTECMFTVAVPCSCFMCRTAKKLVRETTLVGRIDMFDKLSSRFKKFEATQVPPETNNSFW
jgi:hypothetical protein